MYEKYEKYFEEIYVKSKIRYVTFPHHLDIVRHWVEKLCDSHPEADRRVAIVAAIFHDLGHFIENPDPDHAISSEEEARKFMKKEGEDKEFIEKVAHCIRAHRNGDVKPQTLEAKILVFADSASHLTSPDAYFCVAAGRSGKDGSLAKLERDWRDLAFFPEEQEKLEELRDAWRELIRSFPEDFFSYVPHLKK